MFLTETDNRHCASQQSVPSRAVGLNMSMLTMSILTRCVILTRTGLFKCRASIIVPCQCTVHCSVYTECNVAFGPECSTPWCEARRALYSTSNSMHASPKISVTSALSIMSVGLTRPVRVVAICGAGDSRCPPNGTGGRHYHIMVVRAMMTQFERDLFVYVTLWSSDPSSTRVLHTRLTSRTVRSVTSILYATTTGHMCDGGRTV